MDVLPTQGGESRLPQMARPSKILDPRKKVQQQQHMICVPAMGDSSRLARATRRVGGGDGLGRPATRAAPRTPRGKYAQTGGSPFYGTPTDTSSGARLQAGITHTDSLPVAGRRDRHAVAGGPGGPSPASRTRARRCLTTRRSSGPHRPTSSSGRRYVVTFGGEVTNIDDGSLLSRLPGFDGVFRRTK